MPLIQKPDQDDPDSPNDHIHRALAAATKVLASPKTNPHDRAFFEGVVWVLELLLQSERKDDTK